MVVNAGQMTCNACHSDILCAKRVYDSSDFSFIASIFGFFFVGNVTSNPKMHKNNKFTYKIGVPPNKRLFNVVSSTPVLLGWPK